MEEILRPNGNQLKFCVLIYNERFLIGNLIEMPAGFLPSEDNVTRVNLDQRFSDIGSRLQITNRGGADCAIDSENWHVYSYLHHVRLLLKVEFFTPFNELQCVGF